MMPTSGGAHTISVYLGLLQSCKKFREHSIRTGCGNHTLRLHKLIQCKEDSS